MLPEPFEDSRRLTGSNLYFDGTGAALETLRGLVFDDSVLLKWKQSIETARAVLDWNDDTLVLRRHRTGVSLAFTAPADQLYTATEVNEWAWWSALDRRDDPCVAATATVCGIQLVESTVRGDAGVKVGRE